MLQEKLVWWLWYHCKLWKISVDQKCWNKTILGSVQVRWFYREIANSVRFFHRVLFVMTAQKSRTEKRTRSTICLLQAELSTIYGKTHPFWRKKNFENVIRNSLKSATRNNTHTKVKKTSQTSFECRYKMVICSIER